MAHVMVTLRQVQISAVEQDVKIVEQVERDVEIADGDEIVCLIVGRARVFGREVSVEGARLVEVVEVRKP